MSTDVLIEGERHGNDITKRDFDTKDMEEVELVITDEDVKEEVKDDTFSKAQEDDGDKRSSSNTSGIFGSTISA